MYSQLVSELLLLPFRSCSEGMRRVAGESGVASRSRCCSSHGWPRWWVAVVLAAATG